MKHILVIGDPIEGLEFIGPFDTAEDAIDYADGERMVSWLIGDVTEPEVTA